MDTVQPPVVIYIGNNLVWKQTCKNKNGYSPTSLGIRLKSSMRKCKIDTAQPRYVEVKMTKDFTS
jgi:hypothetical protein